MLPSSRYGSGQGMKTSPRLKVTPSGNRNRHPFDGLPVIPARFTEATSWIPSTRSVTMPSRSRFPNATRSTSSGVRKSSNSRNSTSTANSLTCRHRTA